MILLQPFVGVDPKSVHRFSKIYEMRGSHLVQFTERPPQVPKSVGEFRYSKYVKDSKDAKNLIKTHRAFTVFCFRFRV